MSEHSALEKEGIYLLFLKGGKEGLWFTPEYAGGPGKIFYSLNLCPLPQGRGIFLATEVKEAQRGKAATSQNAPCSIF